MLNPFLHSEIDFEQQNIVISVNLYGKLKNSFRRTTNQDLVLILA
jgi:hypothetical protein